MLNKVLVFFCATLFFSASPLYALCGGKKNLQADLLDAVEKGQEKTVEKLLKNVTKEDLKSSYALIGAAIYGKYSIALSLIKAGIDVNKADIFGSTPLMYASARGYKDIVRLLVEHGADITKFDNKKNTALLLAIMSGHIELVNFFLERPEGKKIINAADNMGNTPMMTAALHEHLDILKLLIEKGADVNVINNCRMSVLVCLIEKPQKNLEAIKMLLNAGADPSICDNEQKTLLMYVAEYGCSDLVTLFLPKSSLNAVDKDGLTALDHAKKNGRTEVIQIIEDRQLCLCVNARDLAGVEKCLKGGANVGMCNEVGQTLLMHVAGRGYSDLVKLFLPKASLKAVLNAVDKDGLTALDHAKKNGRAEVIKILEDHLNDQLFFSLNKGDLVGVEDCLKGGADAGERNKVGQTFLIHAIACHDLPAVKLLLPKSSLSAVDANGLTALDYAKQNGWTEVIKILEKRQEELNEQLFACIRKKDEHGKRDLAGAEECLKRGASVTTQKGFLGRPLELAAGNGSESMVKLLLDHGAPIKYEELAWVVRKSGKYTTLLQMLEFLIERGGDVNVRSTTGETLLMVAARGGNKKAAKILLAHDADINAEDQRRNDAIKNAIASGNPQMVKFLVDHGATINRKLDSQRSGTKNRTALEEALFYACHVHVNKTNQFEIAQFLIEKGAARLRKRAPLNELGEHGTPLMSVAWAHNNDAVKLLLEKGADATVCDKEGKTALMHAAMRRGKGGTSVLQTLIDAGVPVDAVDHEGKTALDYAKMARYFAEDKDVGDEEMVAYLNRKMKQKKGLLPLPTLNGHGH